MHVKRTAKTAQVKNIALTVLRTRRKSFTAASQSFAVALRWQDAAARRPGYLLLSIDA